MRGNQPPPAAGPVTVEDIRAVQEVATRSAALDFEHEHSAPELQVAVARAVNHGATIKDVASAAHMTALEVLDAADRFTYPGAAILPEASGPVQ
ncbi:hypothetical protein [Arthrobacter sp. NPDC057013]|uniref:hypothetical protein n=1 Tax=Arthrobacter sp. NPDC057013 TaxID=3345999 RepID=UPI003638AC96